MSDARYVARLRCPYCHEEVAPADVKVGCGRCMAWHHAACLGEHGRCASCGTLEALESAPKSDGSLGRVAARQFVSSWDSWSVLFGAAAEFATGAGSGLLSISHSHARAEGVVTVWHSGFRPKAGRRVDFEIFRSSWDSWAELFEKAGTFAALLAQDELIGFSHSAEASDGVVAVWYWRDAR